MASLAELWQIRWNAINADIIYAPDNAITKYWQLHPELGSPLSGELQLDEGGVAQAFANGIVRWSADTGVVLVAP
jgi:hypothetical protein